MDISLAHPDFDVARNGDFTVAVHAALAGTKFDLPIRLLFIARRQRFRWGIQRRDSTQGLVGGGSSGQQHPQPGQMLEADIQNLNAPRLGGRYNGTDSYRLQLQCPVKRVDRSQEILCPKDWNY